MYVKWDPYVHKAILAHATRSLGSSILTVGSPSRVSWHAAWSYAWTYGKDIWTALIVGILAGAAIQSLIPPTTITALLGKGSIRSQAIAAGAAVPSMMCTCCSAPVVVGLRRQEASTTAALTYWLANPLLNPATIVFTGFVLSWRWALLRLVAGIVVVAVISMVSRRWRDKIPTSRPTVPIPPAAGSPPLRRLLLDWVKNCGRLALWVVPEWAVIALALGAARTWLFPLGAHPEAFGILTLVGLAVAGTLFVIPTAGEVPIASALLTAGGAPGLAGALLITLPAISLPSMVMTRLAFSTRVLLWTAMMVALAGIACGLFTQWAF